DAALLPGNGPGRRLLREHSAGRDLRIEPATLIDAQREAQITDNRCRFVCCTVCQLRDLHLARFERKPHRDGEGRNIRYGQDRNEQHSLPRRPHTRTKRHVKKWYHCCPLRGAIGGWSRRSNSTAKKASSPWV